MGISCLKANDIAKEYFKFVNYFYFVIKQNLKNGRASVDKYFMHVYHTVAMFILKKYENNFSVYILNLHKKFLKTDESDVGLSISKIKNCSVQNKKIDYRVLLFGQFVYEMYLLRMVLSDEDKADMAKILEFSPEEFDLALKISQDPNSVEEYQKIKPFEAYINYLKKEEEVELKDFKNIAVCANMSAGKSTLVNALLGFDFMPAGNEATTACVSSVYDYSYDDNLLGVAIKDNNIIFKDHDVNTKLISEWNLEAEHIVLQAPFADLKLCSIVGLHDTPGLNNSIIDTHRKITMEFLENNEMNVIVYVSNTEHMATDDEMLVLMKIKRMILSKKDIPMVFVMNKFDSIDNVKENKEKMIQKYHEFLENIGYTNPKIYPISARAARIFRMALNNKAEQLSANELDDFPILLKKFTSRLILDDEEATLLKEDEMIEIDGNKYSFNALKTALKHSGIEKLEADLKKYL